MWNFNCIQSGRNSGNCNTGSILEENRKSNRADLYEKATHIRLTVKFDLLSSTFRDEDKLDNTYNVGVLLNCF
jgi:hypothetical protein